MAGKTNWVSKLTDENILAIHRSVICPDTKYVDTYTNKEDKCVEVTAYENWPYEDGTPAYVPTEYRYYDTRYEDWDTNGEEHNGAYRKELIKIFGKEYFVDMVARLTKLDKKFVEEMCSG